MGRVDEGLQSKGLVAYAEPAGDVHIVSRDYLRVRLQPSALLEKQLENHFVGMGAR